MADEPATERTLVLSTQPAGPGERRFAVAAGLLSLLALGVVAPFARVPLPQVAAFIPAYESALVINDLITAALLFGQFAITRSRALLMLANGYVFTTLMIIAHALTFPGLFSDTGLLGAGVQSTAWLYMFWHGGFAAVVIGYAVLEGDGTGRMRMPPSGAITLSVAAVVGLALGLTALATAGESFLPALLRGGGYAPGMIVVSTLVWTIGLLALVTLLARRPPSVLDLWLVVVLCAWLCDIALSAIFNARRFDLGFYAGRIYGLAAASTLLVVLLSETVTLYARLARSIEAERRERGQRLHEIRSELIHVSRLSELGQMVLALAHEVNQPLNAIGNYLSACRRLIQAGNAPTAQSALEKAVSEATRAGEIIRRLRDFVHKRDSEKRAEDLGAMIREIIALSLIGTERPEISVELRLHPDAFTALIDKVQIQQVLLNLIRNAVEAMADHPHPALVIATAPSGNGMVEVSVTDSGPGLPAEVRGRLFQPFVTTKSTGMGVGLSICRSIIEAHGGRLWAEDGPDVGTMFRFTVPLPRAPL